jgi:SpoVK/Ycf46/Vps4 family AAA+-type ATPase
VKRLLATRCEHEAAGSNDRKTIESRWHGESETAHVALVEKRRESNEKRGSVALATDPHEAVPWEGEGRLISHIVAHSGNLQRRFKDGDVLINGAATNADARDELTVVPERCSAAHRTMSSLG